jgi:methyl-accepting chemotaxis protein
MMTAVGEISESTNLIMEAVETSNKEISEIVVLINDISSKTKVINDIVFQTKLLSFNASVEAARAGEHGKGFAVVAEEVGNLAQMSGNAAKEIASMLSDSVGRVEAIVEKTRSKMMTLVQSCREKVDHGSQQASACDKSLSEIHTNVSQVSQMVAEISQAFSEQERGIKQVSTAMNQMDQMTQQNAAVSRQSAEVAQSLKDRAESLRGSVTQLVTIVTGSAHAIGNASKAGDHGPVAASAKKSSSKLIRFERKPPAQPTDEGSEHRSIQKLVVGGHLQVPDRNDERFEA